MRLLVIGPVKLRLRQFLLLPLLLEDWDVVFDPSRRRWRRYASAFPHNEFYSTLSLDGVGVNGVLFVLSYVQGKFKEDFGIRTLGFSG